MEKNQIADISEKLAMQFQYTIEMSNEAVFWLERNGQFSYANAQACRSLGYTNEELLSLFLWDIDPDFPIQRWNEQWENLKTEGTRTFETRHRRKDGYIFPVEVSACQVIFEGKEFHAAYVRDITDRNRVADDLKSSEALYRSLFEYVPDGILVADNNSYYLDANPQMCKMLGYLREELIGLHAIDIVSPKEVEHIEPALDQIKLESEHSREWEFRRKDGSTFDAEVRVNKMPDGSLLALVRDITERKNQENQRQMLENMLHQSHKMEALGTMAGGIAHDFNNILSIISGNTELIQRGHHSGTSVEMNIEHLKYATNRAKEMIKQILAFSRQEKHELTPVDLSLVIDKALSLLRSTLPATIEIIRTGSAHADINADTTQLHQVLINLCANAVHAMNEKGLLTLHLETTELASENLPVGADQIAGQYAKLSVSDTGCGMDAETIDKIFNPFFTTKAAGIGTGMGLSVIHGIVDQHGGFITVDSTVGAGSTFNVFLPVINEGVGVQPEAKKPSLPTGTERILFVDDEECIAYTCNELLECQGYKVASVTSGIEALDLFKANPDAFDLVFTDQTMPVMTGAELATELLKIRPDIPIILCSGYSARVSEEDAKGIGIREFCMKPMDMKQLAIVARKVLDEEANLA